MTDKHTLARYGFRWSGPDTGTHLEMSDGYWTPWHVAQDRITALEAREAELRDLVAKLWCASGCSCCRDDKAWEAASEALGKLLDAPKWSDGLDGYDWYAIRDAATLTKARQS